MVTTAIHLLRVTAGAVGGAATDGLPPTLPPPSTTPPPPPPTPPPYYPCPDGYSQCSLSSCCSSDFGTWSSMALSFVGIVLVLVCCSCWKYVVHARSIRSEALLSPRPRTRRLSETSSAFPSSAPSRSVRVSWHGEPPPVMPDEPPPLYQPCVAVIPLPTTGGATSPLPLPLPPTPATATTSSGRSCGQ